ncbi:hypothetical protein PFICI_06748 [Pestalotiopsis fici W106-1]|uniref:Heterokaryon incompatibility domain-containing protein n=1 Tax=Pestalotiopsis fici (strain W106-1 / CGMCC3.15140) TaxID=1229662 RepID=W3X9C4_PESFW|nr:uncharacterized protein PFICI_06748 [Pestalotiopsis fici W106-1]ETS81746.1 hypothetical protein PFICI_06748 [Pestalotiopsis fici W106-1]
MEQTLPQTVESPADMEAKWQETSARLSIERGMHDWQCRQYWKLGMSYTGIAAKAASLLVGSKFTLGPPRLDRDGLVFVNSNWDLSRDGRRGDANPRRILGQQGLFLEMDEMEPAPYATVSYVWTEFPEVDWDEIRAELERRTGISNLWADRICIDQDDPEDKAMEVRKMSSYYLGASACLIFTKQQGFLEAIEEWKTAGRRLDTKEYLAALDQCVSFIKSSYFERVWTMQELELSAFCYILTPGGWVAGNDIDALLTSAVDSSYIAVPAAARHRPEECRREVWNAGDPEGGFRRMVAVFDKRWTRWGGTDAEWLKSIRRPLMVVWHRAKGRKCSEQKDYLWGISALVEDWEEYGANYEEPMAESMRKVLSKDKSATAILRCRESILRRRESIPRCRESQQKGTLDNLSERFPANVRGPRYEENWAKATPTYQEELSSPSWMPKFTMGVPDLGLEVQLDEDHAEAASFFERRMVMDAVQVWLKKEPLDGVLMIADTKGNIIANDSSITEKIKSSERQDWKRLWVVCQRQKPKSGTDVQYLVLLDGFEHVYLILASTLCAQIEEHPANHREPRSSTCKKG